MGYLGGVAYAMLVARICQLYPNASSSIVVARFFKIYSQWKWPQPVLLKTMEDFPLGMKIWNPKIYQADRFHKMPIITPAYPSMCSTHNVLNSTLTIMNAEFKRGFEIVTKIEEKKATWSNLFAKSDFFYRYKHYFQIIACCDDEEKYRIWSGFVESKIRILSKNLELIPNIEVAPPFCDSFQKESKVKDLESALKQHIYTDHPSEEPEAECEKTFYSMAFYIGMSIKSMTDTPSAGPKKLYIEQPVNEFKQFISVWERYTEDMNLTIRILKRDDLPDYLFEAGKRPSKLKRVLRVFAL